ncbi:MAG: DEAD/DEAH box helicase [Bacteroidia bacterium]|nr:DEAD/DEAH box helicase [Bacteroidia bacterium]
MFADTASAFTTRRVDESAQASAVYAIYPHETYGPLVGAFVVAHNPNGGLSLRYQRLLPENADQFTSILDETDLKLVELLGALSPHQLLKRFGEKGMTPQKFAKKFGASPYKEVLWGFIQGQLAAAYPLLADRPLYLSAGDGYPADKPLQLLPSPASMRFFFTRSPEGTDYRVEVVHGERVLELHSTDGEVLLDEPAWIRSGNTVVRFEGEVDGRKLKPFFAKPVIRIQPKFEQDYYEKFLTKLLEQHEVSLKGFALHEVAPKPEFLLQLLRSSQRMYTLRLRVAYAGVEFLPGQGAEAQVRVLKGGGAEVQFQKILRELATETAVAAQYTALVPELGLADFQATEPEVYAWLAEHLPALQAAGIRLVHDYPGPRLFTGPYALRYAVQRQATEVYATPLVEVDKHTLPLDRFFDKLRNLASPPLTTLDGEVFYLRPEEHLTLRHLLEVGTLEGGRLRLSVAQAALLPNVDPVALGLPGGIGSLPEATLPKQLTATLRPYQKAGFDWLVFLRDHHLGGILADDMGLGKTLQALTLLAHESERKPEHPSLVVVPNSLLFNWLQEIRNFTPQLKVHVYAGTKRVRTENSLFRYDILLTTYGMVRQDIGRLARTRFHYIVLDESQYIKNRDAKTTQAVLKLDGKHRLSLTGTPIENSTLELWTQFQFLNPGLLGGRRFFEDHYATPIEKYQDEARANRLKHLVRPFILRRTKGQVAPELPELVEQVRYCELSPEQERLYDQEREQLHASLFSEALATEENFERSKFQILSSLQRLRQIAIHPRLIDPDHPDTGGKHEALWEHLEDILAEGSKVLIFSQFVRLLQILKTELNERGVTYSYLDGQTQDREKAVNYFQEDPNVQVFLISLKAGGVGLNLTAAEYVLLLDPWWNPAVEAQAIARAHRIGQHRTVFAYKFITQGTIEESILELQARKARVANEIIQNDEQFFKKLTRQELLNLLDRPRQAPLAEDA